MADPKKAIAKTYKDAYGEGSTRDLKTDRFSALDDSQLGGSFQSLGKKQGQRAYRDRRSGKTFYVNSRGEVIKGSGEKDTTRFAQDLEGRIVKAVDKKINIDFEAEQTKLGNRPHDPDAGKDLQEQLTSRGIAEGKSVGEAQLAADQVEREDRRAYAIQKDLEGVQGYADPDEVARRAAGISTGASTEANKQSPLTKTSPLYQRVQFQNLNTTGYDQFSGNYANLSKRIGESVGGAVQEIQSAADRRRAEEDRQREQQRQDLNQDIQRNAYVQQKIKQNEALIVPGDTGYNNVDIAVNNATRALTDRAGALTSNLKKGKTVDDEGNEVPYDIDQYAQDYATIQSQVPGIKKWKDTLSANLGTYAQGLQDGTLSKANGIQTNDLYASLMKEDGSFTLDMDGNRVVFSGTTEAGEPVMIPVNGSERMPKPVLAQPAPHEILKPGITELQKRLSTWGPEGAEFAKQQLDSILGQGEGGENKLLSFAVDHYDMPLDEAKKLLLEPVEGFTSALESAVEERWVQDAKATFVNQQLTAAQAADLAFKEQQLKDQQSQGANASLMKFYSSQEREKVAGQRLDVLANTPSGLTQYSGAGKGTIQNITYDEGSDFWNTPPTYSLTLKNGEELELSPSDAKAYIANTLGIPQGVPQTQNQGDRTSASNWLANRQKDKNPVQKKSPLEKTDPRLKGGAQVPVKPLKGASWKDLPVNQGPGSFDRDEAIRSAGYQGGLDYNTYQSYRQNPFAQGAAEEYADQGIYNALSRAPQEKNRANIQYNQKVEEEKAAYKKAESENAKKKEAERQRKFKEQTKHWSSEDWDRYNSDIDQINRDYTQQSILNELRKQNRN